MLDRVGRCGWSSLRAQDRRQRLARKLQLPAARHCIVEVNSTSRPLPRASTAARWRRPADVARPDSRFTLKVSRQLTPPARLPGPDAPQSSVDTSEIACPLRFFACCPEAE
ncbi:MAG: hypothetical protein ACP5G2_02270 [Candidatus Bipolaricaulaceae bacterium]